MAGVASMVAVLHLVLLAASHFGLVGINDYANVSLIVTLRVVPRLVSASNELRNQDCHSAKREALSVEEVDCPSIFIRFRNVSALRFGDWDPTGLAKGTVDQTVVNVGEAMADVWVELDPAVLFFGLKLLNRGSVSIVSPFVLD